MARPVKPSAKSPRRRSRDDPPRRLLRAKLWVETNGRPAINEDAAALLEQIGACGSLSEAARRLGFSYRRAWMLLDLVNRQWPSPLVLSTTGGRRGGGAVLTELGHHVLRTYRSLLLQLEHLLAESGDPFDPMP